MAENRCSMCGNTNAADAQVCAQCGARLTPVRPSKPRNTGKFTGGLSWLDAFREETQPADAGASAFEQSESSYEQEMSSFEEESPAFEQPANEDDAPDWLQRIRDRNGSDQGFSSYDADDEIRVDEGSFGMGADSGEDVPDWLRGLKEQDEPAAARQEAAEEIPSWQDAMRTWDPDSGSDSDYEEESIASAFEEKEEPKVTEWFSRIMPGDEEEKSEPGQTVNFGQDDFQTPGQTVNFEQEDIQEPKQTVIFQQESDVSDAFSFSESEDDEISEETALPDDDEFMAEFSDYELPSGFTEEEYSEAKGEEVQYEDWETRSATLYSVTESASENDDVPSWLDEDGEGDSTPEFTPMDDSAQSVLNWLDDLDKKEGGKQKARYWMGEVDTGELPPEQTFEPSYKEPERKEESVYDPFAEDKTASPGSTQFFSENELDDEYEMPAKSPGHTMMFGEDEDQEDIPDWLSEEPGEQAFDAGEKKAGQTVGLSGLDDAALGMDLPEDEKAPWNMESFEFGDEEEITPKTPIMTAQLSGFDDEDEQKEDELPPWMEVPSTEPTEPRKRTPIMTAELSGFDEDEDEDLSASWLKQDDVLEDEALPKAPKMTAALPGLDDEDLGMNLEDDEIPPWLQQSTEDEESVIPKTPIMTAALEGFDDDEEDETIPWMQDAEPQLPGKKPSLMTAALTGVTDEDFETEDEPEWMQDIKTADVNRTPSQPLMTAELPDLGDESAEDLPSWMHEVDRAADEQPSQPFMAAGSSILDEEPVEEETPFWMQDVDKAYDEQPSQPFMAAQSSLPDEEPVEEETPFWMQDVDKAYDEQPSQPLMTAELPDLDEGAAEEETPFWMKDDEQKDVQKAPSQPLMTAALTGFDEEDLQDDEAPAWMQDVEEVATPTKGTPTMTAALTGLDDDDFQTEETPAWMQDLEEIAPPPGAMPIMTASLPDLDQNEPTLTPPVTQPPVEDEEEEIIPDWMRTVEETRQLGSMPGQPPAKSRVPESSKGQKSPFTVGLTGDAEEKEQTIDEMFSNDLFSTGKLNEMDSTPTGVREFLAESEDERSIDELFSDDLLSTGKLNEMIGTPPGVQETPFETEDEQSIDEMFSDQLLTTGRLNAMSGTTDGAQAFMEDEESIDEMFSDQLLTTGKLNAMVGMPGVNEEQVEEEDQSIDEMFSDQLLTTGMLNAMSGVPPAAEEVGDESDSIDDVFSDQLLTTGKLNEMVGMPGEQAEESHDDQSVDEMFSDQLFTTGILNKMHVQDQSDEEMSIDEAFSDDLLNTGRLKEMSAGLDATQAMPAEEAALTPVAADDDWLANFGDAGAEDDMLVGASEIDDEPRVLSGDVIGDGPRVLTGQSIDDGPKALPEPVSPASDMPDWLAELEPEAKEDETSPAEGPAFVFEKKAKEPEESEESHPFAGDDLPNWLSPDVWQADGQPAGEKAPESAEAGVANIQWELEGLEKGELPSWLQKIKPEKTPAKVQKPLIAGKTDEQSEKVGPLAGLAGVLPAQDTVTMHRRPPVYSDQLMLTEQQSNRTQVFARMIESEAKNKTFKVELEKIPFKLIQTIFAVVLMIIMMIPLSGLVPITGGIPFDASDPVVSFFNEVEKFPQDSSVLLVMDFESGYTAEMRSSLDGLMMRLYEKNIDVAMISTLPTGPVIAEEIAQDNWWAYYSAHPEINVIDYESRVLNLGYLPGGSAAMLQFVRYPRQSVQYGFRFEKNPTSVWNTNVLSDIYSTNDFSGVIVITDSANVSRNWIEQTTLYALDNILFITSAQAYPLILPYWQSGQVKGLIAGVYQGYTYRTLLGQSEGLAPKWYSYMFGMNLVTIVAIFLTIIYVIRNTLPRIRKAR